MNIFVLNSGRCGSTSFIEACRSISNYSAGHESRIQLCGESRLDYPQRHIEADNRLSWLLGRLERCYGADAHYVYLRRNRRAVVESFRHRADFGIMRAYREGVLLGGTEGVDARTIADDYLTTVESNIELFLRDKPHTMEFWLERAVVDFTSFWHWIGAEGDLEQAIASWSVPHNATSGQPLP